uniref:Putative secreted protein n=1 Tax=Anopheles darlingi TaxID=43151 RepID=A0A2M4DAZ6_ANODA
MLLMIATMMMTVTMSVVVCVSPQAPGAKLERSSTNGSERRKGGIKKINKQIKFRTLRTTPFSRSEIGYHHHHHQRFFSGKKSTNPLDDVRSSQLAGGRRAPCDASPSAACVRASKQPTSLYHRTTTHRGTNMWRLCVISKL